MSTFQIAFNNTTKVATVQPDNDALPVGSVNIGTFDHVSDADDQLEGMVGVPDNHVFFHHVREALYKRSAANPAVAGFWPDNITDMAGITITLDVIANPLPQNTVAPDVSGTIQVGQVATTTDGTWSNTPTSYARQWKTSTDAAGLVNVTNVGAGETTYTPLVGDVDKYLFCDVIASNANGAATAAARSGIVGPIIAA